MWNELTRFVQLPRARKYLLGEAFLVLAVVGVTMTCLPFRRIAAWLGKPGAEGPATITADELTTARAVGWAVGAIGRRVPWDGRCLAQALGAVYMLRRRGLEGTVSFGVCKGASLSFDAHAWLRVGSYVVTGGPGYQQFNVLTTFARTSH